MSVLPTSKKPSESLPWIALAVAFVAQLGNAAANLAIAPLAPLIQAELSIDKTAIGLFASATYAGSCGALIPFGFLTDRFGVRKILGLSQAIVGVCLASMGMVGSFLQGLTLMLVAGLGTGGVNPAVSKAVVDWFPPRLRATAMGIKQAAVPVAGILTAALLPSLGLLIGWRFAIVALGVTVLVVAALSLVYYPEHPSARIASGSRGRLTDGFGDLLRNRSLWQLTIVCALYSMAQMGMVTYLALYFSDELLVQSFPELSKRVVAAGAFLALTQVAGVVGRLSWGMISDRQLAGRRMSVLLMVGVISATAAGAMSQSTPYWPLWVVAAIVLMIGASAMAWAGVYIAAAAEIAGPGHAATGVGLSMMLIQSGNVAGPVIFGIIVDNAHSFSIAWLAMAAIFIIGILIALPGIKREWSVRPSKGPSASGSH